MDVHNVAKNSPWLELKRLPARGDFALEEDEAREIDTIYVTARAALESITPGPEAGALKRAVKLEWAREMESFLDTHPDSAWAPGIAQISSPG